MSGSGTSEGSKATQFKKGQSGNPGGKAPIVTSDGKSITEIAREHTQDAINTLASICKTPTEPAAARVSAAQHLLDRGWGRPKQDIDLNAKVTHETWLQRLLGMEGEEASRD